MAGEPWDRHYTRNKSELVYPDENLVRLLRRYLPADSASVRAVDLGCGSGRHIPLLLDCGIRIVLGADASFNALTRTRTRHDVPLVQCDNRKTPFQSESIDIVVAWGSLHYGNRADLDATLSEVIRILKAGGRLFATLRTDRDTHLARGEFLGNGTWRVRGGDIHGAEVSFYREEDLEQHLAGFAGWAHGIMERTPVGNISSLISHWIIHAWK